MKLHVVPYDPQTGKGADVFRNDCGAACGKMLLNWSGKAESGLTVDALYREMNPSGQDTYLSAGQIARALARRGLIVDWTAPGEFLPINVPSMPLVWRSPLVDAMQYEPGLAFRGAHWVVVVGFDEDWVCYHDPYFSGPAGGAYRWIRWDVFDKAWSNVPQGDGMSVRRMALIPRVPDGNALRMKVTYPNGIWVRTGPGREFQIVGSMAYNDQASIFEIKETGGGRWARIGEGRWAALEYAGQVLAVVL